MITNEKELVQELIKVAEKNGDVMIHRVSTLYHVSKELEKKYEIEVKENHDATDSYSIIILGPNKIGRPSLGETKKVSVTIPSDVWEKIESSNMHKSEFFRIAAQHYLACIDNEGDFNVLK